MRLDAVGGRGGGRGWGGPGGRPRDVLVAAWRWCGRGCGWFLSVCRRTPSVVYVGGVGSWIAFVRNEYNGRIKCECVNTPRKLSYK